MGRAFAIGQIFLSCGAAIGYAYQFNWRMMAYWIAAAVLTGAVTLGDDN